MCVCARPGQARAATAAAAAMAALAFLALQAVTHEFDAARRATLTFYLIFRLAAFLHDTSREGEEEKEKQQEE